MTEKTSSLACERNKACILEQLQHVFCDSCNVLEIGSGTGQHAVHFAASLPYLVWQTSDMEKNHAAINAWIADSELKNVRNPLIFDVTKDELSESDYDAIFTANTFHIMAWDVVVVCIQKIGNILQKDGLAVVYGPFNFNGKYTSTSNSEFDSLLKSQDKKMGIRNFEEVEKHFQKHAMVLVKKIPMPANNFILVFRKM